MHFVSRYRMVIAMGLLLTATACSDDSADSTAFKGDDNNGGYYGSDIGLAPYLYADVSETDAEKYDPVGTNPFVVVAHDPFSTFAADVDTASYDIFRRDINNGSLPNPDSVRLEEFVNYFNYDYPAPEPDAEHPFAISLAAADNLASRESVLLRVAIQAENPPPFEKKPANLVFLIDVSGSMTDANKLPLVQHLLKKALDVLEADDKVSIVTYAGSTEVRLTPTPVSQKSTIVDVIDSLSSGGSTAGSAGIDLAYQQAESGFIDGGINHVVLLTDGDFNVGPSSNEALVSLIEEKRESGITLTVLGFGTGNLNDAMMEKISNAGNGIYGVISSQSQADSYVENRLLSNLVLVAKDMKIQVEFNPDAVFAYRLLGYENRAIADEDFRDDAVDAGEVGAGHRVTALYEVILVGQEIPSVDGAPEVDDGDPVDGEREISTADLVLVKVRYKEVDADADDAAFEVRRSLTPDNIAASCRDLDTDFQWAAAMAAYAEILKESPYADKTILPLLSDIFGQETGLDEEREAFKTLFETSLGLLD